MPCSKLDKDGQALTQGSGNPKAESCPPLWATVPVLTHAYCEEFFSYAQLEFALLLFVTVAFCPSIVLSLKEFASVHQHTSGKSQLVSLCSLSLSP